MSEWAPKRFWTDATVGEVNGGFDVRLDGRAIKTPAKTALVMPSRTIAEAVAAEWQAQEKQIDPNTMPVTRAVNAALDKVTPQRGEVVDMLAAYGDSDLLCYRATSPEELVARQAAAWDPLLDWAAQRFGARLLPVQGVMHQPQDAAAIAALRDATDALDAFELTAFHDLVSLSGSLVIGLAAVEAQSAPERLWETSRIDEAWQEEQWGADDEATEVTRRKREAFLSADRFLKMLRAG